MRRRHDHPLSIEMCLDERREKRCCKRQTGVLQGQEAASH